MKKLLLLVALSFGFALQASVEYVNSDMEKLRQETHDRHEKIDQLLGKFVDILNTPLPPEQMNEMKKKGEEAASTLNPLFDEAWHHDHNIILALNGNPNEASLKKASSSLDSFHKCKVKMCQIIVDIAPESFKPELNKILEALKAA